MTVKTFLMGSFGGFDGAILGLDRQTEEFLTELGKSIDRSRIVIESVIDTVHTFSSDWKITRIIVYYYK